MHISFDSYQFEKPAANAADDFDEVEKIADYGPARTAEQAEAAGIAAGLIASAARDLKGIAIGIVSDSGRLRAVDDAIDWITCENEDEGSFFWCCDILGIPRQRLRRTIAEWCVSGCPGGDILRSGRGQQTIKDRRAARSILANNVSNSSLEVPGEGSR